MIVSETIQKHINGQVAQAFRLALKRLGLVERVITYIQYESILTDRRQTFGLRQAFRLVWRGLMNNIKLFGNIIKLW